METAVSDISASEQVPKWQVKRLSSRLGKVALSTICSTTSKQATCYKPIIFILPLFSKPFSLFFLPYSEKSCLKFTPGDHLNTTMSFLSPHGSQMLPQHPMDCLLQSSVVSHFWVHLLHKLEAKMPEGRILIFVAPTSDWQRGGQ